MTLKKYNVYIHINALVICPLKKQPIAKLLSEVEQDGKVLRQSRTNWSDEELTTQIAQLDDWQLGLKHHPQLIINNQYSHASKNAHRGYHRVPKSKTSPPHSSYKKRKINTRYC